MRIPITDKLHTETTIHQSSATAAPPRPRPADDDAETVSHEADIPDPTAPTPEDAGEESTAGDARESDPTVPPATQPVDFGQRARATLGAVAAETAGHAGSDVSGGEVTRPQDAERAVEEHVAMRTNEEEMWERQAGGEVETQTKDLKPSPGHPEEGMPQNPSGSENTGGANSDEDSESDADAGADANTTARAAAEADERFLRLAADFENYKRQAARREKEVRERANMGLVEDLLPVLDNFERALDAAKNAKDIESLRVGIDFIAQQLREVLKNHGVEPIQAHGQSFDPLHHEALAEVQDTGHPEGTIVGEAQRGYKYRGQVLRPSRVTVAGRDGKE